MKFISFGLSIGINKLDVNSYSLEKILFSGKNTYSYCPIRLDNKQINLSAQFIHNKGPNFVLFLTLIKTIPRLSRIYKAIIKTLINVNDEIPLLSVLLQNVI